MGVLRALDVGIKEEPGIKLRLERWKSSDNEEEIHFFVGQRYIAGYNPKVVDGTDIEDVLLKLGYTLPSDAVY